MPEQSLWSPAERAGNRPWRQRAENARAAKHERENPANNDADEIRSDEEPAVAK